MVKPRFFKHAELYDAEVGSGLPLRLAYQGLWCVADRRGVFRWRPRELKAEILPFDAVDFAAVLEALARAGFVRRFVVGEREYGWIPTLARQQTFHQNERPDPDLPDPPGEPAAEASVHTIDSAAPPSHRAEVTTAPPRGSASTPVIGYRLSESESAIGSSSRAQELDYATRCVVAVNHALDQLKAGGYRPLVVAEERPVALAWEQAGIPHALAERVLTDRTLAYRRPGQPHTLRYFDGAVQEAWAAAVAKSTGVTTDADRMRQAIARAQGAA